MGLSDGNHRSVPEFNQADLKDAIIKGYYGEGGYSAITPTLINRSADHRIYNLQGQQVQNPQHGIFIQNGKKYVMR